MSERIEEFGEGVEFALVTFSDPKYARAYKHRTGWPGAWLVDRDRELYRRFGFGQGSIWRVYGWKAIGRYVRIFRENGFAALGGLHKATEDTLQLGGDVVLDPDGEPSWIFEGAGPDDRPTVDELIARTATARNFG